MKNHTQSLFFICIASLAVVFQDCSASTVTADGGAAGGGSSASGGGGTVNSGGAGGSTGGGSASTGKALAEPCSRNSDCASAICLPVGGTGGPGWTGNICTQSCTTNAQCVAGWTCGALLGQATSVCKCTSQSEVCDSKDNDCNGLSDEQPQADAACAADAGPGHSCNGGTCACPICTTSGGRECGDAQCNGQCVNLQADPQNCGSCGAVCGSTTEGPGICTGGRCLRSLGNTYYDDVCCAAVSATEFFWLGTDYFRDSVVYRAPLDGSSPAAFIASTATPSLVGGFAFNGAKFFWTARFQNTVLTAPLNGGPQTVLASAQNEPTALVVDATHVYWLNSGTDGGLMKVPIDGGTPVVLASGQSNPGSIALDTANIYWVTTNTVMKVPKVGGAPSVLASGQPTPNSIATDGTYVYWTNFGYQPMGSTVLNSVMKVAISGGTPVTLASDARIASIATDGTSVYWSTREGYVRKMPATGGQAETLVSQSRVDPFMGLLLGPQTLYFVGGQNGSAWTLTPR